MVYGLCDIFFISLQVMGNCKGIPDYTPVGMFSFGTFVQDGSAVAGIITDCTANGFKVNYIKLLKGNHKIWKQYFIIKMFFFKLCKILSIYDYFFVINLRVAMVIRIVLLEYDKYTYYCEFNIILGMYIFVAFVNFHQLPPIVYLNTS